MLYKNYGDLIKSVCSWLDREDFVEHMPEFVRMVTVDATRDLRVPTMEKIRYLQLSPDGGVEVPHDYVEGISVSYVKLMDEEIVQKIPLYRSSMLKYKEAWNIQDKLPRSFVRQGSRFMVFPYVGSEPDAVFSCHDDIKEVDAVELIYYAMPETMEKPEDINWVLGVAPDVYFYGCMMHSCRFVRDMESASFWEVKYKDAKTQLQGVANKSDQSGGSWMLGDDYYE